VNVSFLAVFAAGVFTVLSPCVLPVAPILVSGLVTADHVSRWSRLRATLLFALGFAVVFVLLGLGVSALTNVAQPLRPVFLTVAAMTLALYGLKMTNVLNARRRLAWMDRSLGVLTVRPSGNLPAVAFGVMFGLTWTPCAGPVLGGVLTYVARREQGTGVGALMLLTYAAGVATPLLLIAVASEYVVAQEEVTCIRDRSGRGGRTPERR
jgi:cytochrome c-type biogenesis protein